MRFEWDEAKRQEVLAERGVDFVDAAGIFDGPTIVQEDDRASYGEKRYIAIGEAVGQCFVVVYTIREEAYRIITAWRGGKAIRRRLAELLGRGAEGDP
jgi:uncharacterized DUF497 family protein